MITFKYIIREYICLISWGFCCNHLNWTIRKYSQDKKIWKASDFDLEIPIYDCHKDIDVIEHFLTIKAFAISKALLVCFPKWSVKFLCFFHSPLWHSLILFSNARVELLGDQMLLRVNSLTKSHWDQTQSKLYLIEIQIFCHNEIIFSAHFCGGSIINNRWALSAAHWWVKT